jgi:hypothetical protein
MFAEMNNDFRKICVSTATLSAIAILIKIFSVFPLAVETYYSTGIYFYISVFLRAITRWFPFSLGDFLYAVAAIYLLVKLIKNTQAIFQKKITKQSFLFGLIKVIRACLWIYIVFNIFWGLNYNRLGIAYQLQIQPGKYTTEELKTLTDSLVIKVNAARRSLGDSTYQYPSDKEIFAEAITAYEHAEKQFPFLVYHQSCIKKTLYGKLGDYLGFEGYYNPFTAESQVNATIPPFSIPYTTTHEMAHQLGYGDEDEANFVGYIAAKASPENAFHYSVYFDLFNYANRELFYRDSNAAHENYKALDTLVKRDKKIYRKFLIEYKNPVDYYVTKLYGGYLRANNQPNGMDTYSEVTAWLIAYQKKYRTL